MAIIDEDKKKNEEVVGGNFKGVDDATMDKIKPQSFTESDKVTELDKQTQDAHSNLETLTSKDKLISDDTMATINSSFKTPTAVKQADKWLSNQLSIIQSGKTSYSDQVRDMMDKIMGREKFSYDVDKDPLFQQALASSMNAGKQAMQDTIGQASALTGGYGSTYATSAGNQAYNAFIEDAYDNLPQYYQMALEAYQMEGDEMYRQYGMLSAEDDKEFNRNVTAYDATYQHRNQMYNEAYGQFRDAKSDAFASANLQLNEHGQRVNDAYNYYNATSNMADKMYEREYSKWADEINMAYKYAEMMNSDWWKQTELDFTASENQLNRDHQSSENALDRTHQSTENQINREWKTTESQKDRDWKTVESQKDREFKASENAKNRSVKGSGGISKPSTLTSTEMSKVEEKYIMAGGGEKGLVAVDAYLTSVGKNNLDDEGVASLQAILSDVDVPAYYQEWNMYDANGNILDGADDTYNGGFLGTPLWAGDDHNDVYTNGTTTMTYDEIVDAINGSDLDESIKKQKIKALKKQSKK